MNAEVAQQNTVEPTAPVVSEEAEFAALKIYDAMKTEGFDIEGKIAIVKSLLGQVNQEVDENIRFYQRLKAGIKA